MNTTSFLKRFIRNYFISFAAIVILLTVLRDLFSPVKYFTVRDIYVYMICAFVANLPGLILYSSRALSEKEMRLRLLIHFVTLEAVLLVLGNVTGWVTGIHDTTLFSVQIAVIYAVSRYLIFMDDRKSAFKINEKLEKIKSNPVDELEEK